jgi:hypothetical protein
MVIKIIKQETLWKIKWPFFILLVKKKKSMDDLTIIFRLGPVQDSGFRFWPGHPDQFFFKKSKRRCFTRKKINELQPSFWSGLAGSTRSVGLSGHTRFFFSLFFLKSSLVLVPGWFTVSSRVLKLWI